MLSRIVEGDRFKSPFSETIFQVKKIFTNTVLLEDIGDQDHQLITEMFTLGSFYQKVGRNVPRSERGII